jgi:hypothetical protein
MNRTSYLVLGVAAATAIAVASITASAADSTTQGTAALVSYDCNSQPSSGLQAAENSLATGGTLIVSGSCTTGLTLQAETTLAGNNAGTVLHGAVTYNSPLPVTIRDIQVSCGNAPACLNIENGWRVNIENIVTYGGTTGIELSAPTCGKGSGCNVNDYLAHNFINNTSGYGIWVNDPTNTITDGFITDSWIANGTDSIHLDNAAGWQVVNNHVYGESGRAVYANRLYGSQVTGTYAEKGGLDLIAQSHSQPSEIDGNKLNAGTITQTSLGAGCRLTIVGNVTATAPSFTGCTVSKAANLFR